MPNAPYHTTSKPQPLTDGEPIPDAPLWRGPGLDFGIPPQRWKNGYMRFRRVGDTLERIWEPDVPGEAPKVPWDES